MQQDSALSKVAGMAQPGPDVQATPDAPHTAPAQSDGSARGEEFRDDLRAPGSLNAQARKVVAVHPTGRCAFASGDGTNRRAACCRRRADRRTLGQPLDACRYRIDGCRAAQLVHPFARSSALPFVVASRCQ